jgi:hypothetical protein
MIRRAGAAAAALAFAALPCALLAAAEPASADSAAAGQAKAPAVVTITGMSSLWAAPGETMTVRGTLTNDSGKPISNPQVQLQSSGTPITGLTALQQYADGTGAQYTYQIPGATWHSAASLQPGASVRWSARLRVNDVGMTAFGVYPLEAAATDVYGYQLASADSYVPYEPARHGPYAKSRPSARQVAWAWPLVGDPMLTQPWQGACSGAQPTALAASLAGTGRLGALLSVGKGGGAASLAGIDDITWAADPALLADVRALADCGSAYPAGARAAAQWLTAFRRATAGQQLFVMPYADVNVAALVDSGHAPDVDEAFSLGASTARSVLSGLDKSGSGKPAYVTGIAWPSGGVANISTLGALGADGIRTVLVDSKSAAPAEAVVQTSRANGTMRVLVADRALTEALGSPSGTQASAFTAKQLFLAETAELAAADPAQPIIIAPPQRWQPSAALAQGLLSESAAAPWLRPASLAGVAAAKHAPPQVGPGAVSTPQTAFSHAMQDQISTVDRQITYIQALQAYPNSDLWLAAATLESSAWTGAATADEAAEFRVIENHMYRQGAVVARRQTVAGVELIADGRVTLGGLKGSVPVSIYNKLGYAVRVRLQVSQGSGGLVLHQSPAGRITVPAHHQLRVELHVQATQVGTTSVTMRLIGARWQQLAGARPVTMTIEATQFGTLAMIILAVALGVFLVASAARAVHRGQARADGPETDGQGQRAPAPQAPASASASGGSEGQQADGVAGQRTGLGTAGKPGL